MNVTGGDGSTDLQEDQVLGELAPRNTLVKRRCDESDGGLNAHPPFAGRGADVAGKQAAALTDSQELVLPD